MLFFKGVSAHEGDDSRVLSRRDRRIILTLLLYVFSLVTAGILEETGPVISATGSIGGSSLAYIGPGASFLAIWGHKFLDLVRSRWQDPSNCCYGFPQTCTDNSETETESDTKTSIGTIVWWYASGMPLWCSIAQTGETKLTAYFEKEQLISPGIILPRRVTVNQIKAIKSVQTQLQSPSLLATVGTAESSLLKSSVGAMSIYGTAQDTSQDEEMLPMNRIDSFTSVEVRIEMDKSAPNMRDFVIAIGYIVLGVVAMTLGLGSLVQQ